MKALESNKSILENAQGQQQVQVQTKLIFSNITAENVEEDVQGSTNDTFKIGMWFLSKVIEGHQFEIYGSTMKFAHEHHGITSYRGAQEFDDGMDELLEALKIQ